MAVGPMDSNVEGVCILDFLTGELTVTVMDTDATCFEIGTADLSIGHGRGHGLGHGGAGGLRTCTLGPPPKKA